MINAIGRFFLLSWRVLRPALSLLPYILAYVKGRRDKGSKQTREELKAVKDAKKIRDRLNHDPDFVKRVRERFKR